MLLKWAIPNLFLFISCNFYTIKPNLLHNKNVDFSGIRSRIVEIEGNLADHLTTTTAPTPTTWSSLVGDEGSYRPNSQLAIVHH